MNLKKIVIDNTKDSAIESKPWDPNPNQMINEAVNSSTPVTLLKEMFLVHPEGAEIKTQREYSYPHHTIVDNKCVLDIAGVKAAYARVIQQGIYEGAIKEHIDQHRNELGLIQEEAKKESITAKVDKALSILKEALRPKIEYQSDNMFTQMFEKPIVTPAENGTPVGTAQPAAQPQAAPVDTTQAAPTPDPSTQPTTDQPTIPVQNANPTEDTSTNNPVEGPDDRDQDNLDGIQRKEMYQQWADLMLQLNSNNVFGTIFDQDVFKSEYKIVPYEMRYFYRLQNPVSVSIDDLSFIPFGTELLEAQDKYGLGKKMFVFATNNEKPIFFNMLDKTIWFNDTKLNDSFDGFIEQLTQNNGELQIPEEGEENQETEVDYQQNPDQIPTDQNTPTDATAQATPETAPADQAPVDLSQNSGNMTLTTGLENDSTTPGATPSGNVDNMEPVDLNAPQAMNASVEYIGEFDYSTEDIDISILELMDESVESTIKKNMDIFKQKYKFRSKPAPGMITIDNIDILCDLNIDNPKAYGDVDRATAATLAIRLPSGLTPAMMFDKYFFRLPPKKADAVVYHEFGHIVLEFRKLTLDGSLKHKDMLDKLKPYEIQGINSGHANANEYIADGYGASRTSRRTMNSAVKKMIKMNIKENKKQLKSMRSRIGDNAYTRDLYERTGHQIYDGQELPFDEWCKQFKKLLNSQLDQIKDFKHDSYKELKARYKATKDPAIRDNDIYDPNIDYGKKSMFGHYKWGVYESIVEPELDDSIFATMEQFEYADVIKSIDLLVENIIDNMDDSDYEQILEETAIGNNRSLYRYLVEKSNDESFFN